MSQFLAQGGYGAFVWGAYAISAFALALAVALTLTAYGCAKRALARLENKP